MRLFELEADDNTVYFSFINSNPPTFGYKRALDTLRDLSGDADIKVFINPAQDNKYFPLDFKKNLEYNRKIFTGVSFDHTGQVENPIQALKKLSNDYSKVYFVVRDKYINDYKRMHNYAEQWGVSSFEIIGLGDSKRPLPTGVSKDAAIEAVTENDFDAFKKTIPSNNKQLVSRLFLDLREVLIDDEYRETDEDEIKESIYETIKAVSFNNTGYLNESCSRDIYRNKTFTFEGIIDSLKNLKIVFNPKSSSNVKAGRDTNDNNMVIIMKCNEENLGRFLDLHENDIKKAIGVYIKETTTSANVATVNGMFGDIVKRKIDFDEVKNLTFNDHTPKYMQALNHIVNKYGYMDSKTAEKLRSMLERW